MTVYRQRNGKFVMMYSHYDRFQDDDDDIPMLAANELYGKNPLHWWPAIWGTKVDVQNQHTKGVVLDEFGPSRVYMIDHCTLKFRKKADATLYCLKYLS